MVSSDFATAIKNKNVLLTRIMLKDSMIVDPTFRQFDEMLSYARVRLTGLVVDYDGKHLEEDQTRWNVDLMNQELVELVSNFSMVRIRHLKRVISVALADQIRKPAALEASNQDKKVTAPDAQPQRKSATHPDITEYKTGKQNQAVKKIKDNGSIIADIMKKRQEQGHFMSSDFGKMKAAAVELLYAIHTYEDNK